MSVPFQHNFPSSPSMMLPMPSLICSHPYTHTGDCVAHKCHCVQSNQSTHHTCNCVDKRLMCKYGHRYWCPHCNYGVPGMFSKCTNDKCVIFNKSMPELSE